MPGVEVDSVPGLGFLPIGPVCGPLGEAASRVAGGVAPEGPKDSSMPIEPAVRASLILPTRDRVAGLGITLETLRRQRIPPGWRVQAILVDNGSRDATGEALRAFAAEPGPWEPVLLEVPRGGKSAALNAGIRQARGEVLLFTDDDMDHDPGWAAGLVSFLEGGGWAGALGRIEVAFPEGRPPWVSRKAEGLLGATHEAARPDGTVGHLCGGNMAVLAEAAARAGPFREDMGPLGARTGYSEDVEWSLRVGRQGPLGYCPEAVNWHRIPAARASRAFLCRRQFGMVRAEWRLKGRVGRPGQALSELRGLVGALVRRRRAFEGCDFELEIAARLGRLAALAGPPVGG